MSSPTEIGAYLRGVWNTLEEMKRGRAACPDVWAWSRERAARNAAEEAERGAAVDTSAGAVAERLEGVLGDLLCGRTTAEQRRGLRSATDRADRVTPGSDAAVGRALR